jgi:hypothetical protein
MKKSTLLACAFSLFASGLFAQNESERQKVLSGTNVSKLKTLSQEIGAKQLADKKRALEVARQKGWQVFIEMPDGNIAELQRIDDTGKPVYYVTQSNLDAATTTKASRLWTGGSMGLNLNGQGMIVGEWDGGPVRATHQEFGTRVVQKDGVAFTTSNGNNNHATHVAGTLIASGVTANSKGMAHQGTLWANEWNNDTAEMANQAAQGLILSNHSYGYNSAALSAWQFGFYDATSAQWDEIAFNAPFYTIVKAAGNDRGAGYNPGGVFGTTGYNLVTGSACSKNVLVVAAVSAVTNYTGPSSVTMSSFSSWGPTDDGRIKPDISGMGVNVYSTSSSSNTAYATLSGTSMASPNVTGTLTLIQQHYKNLNGGNFMRSATLRGLVIHTADEAGSANGPDYRFGWGLLNAEKAVNAITNRGTSAIIDERTLSNGTTYTTNVVASGTAPLEVTIAWNDPKGTPLASGTSNSTSVRLVNDLDVRVTYNGTTTLPWRLDPAAPANAATKGDNFRDNVEKIIVETPVAGATYTITVSHKGTLASAQAYSLIVTGISSGAPTCPVPASLSTSSITSSGATLNWGAVTGASTYDVRLRAVGASTWTDFTGRTGTSLGVTGLAASTSYEWQIRTNCSGASSAYSASSTFTTSAATVTCSVPASLSTSSITSSGATLNWGAVTGASTYDVRLRAVGASTWTDFTGRTGTSLGVTGLAASTNYEWQIRTNCSGASSAYSASSTFTTSAATVTWCASRGNNNQYEWIDLVQMGSINRTSGRETNGYLNTGLSTNVTRGASQTIGFSAGFSSTAYTEYWKVWIDWNRNGSFDDAGELVVSGTSSSSGTLTATFTVPTTAVLGQTRMRVSMSDANQTSCSNPFSYGEVEDYTVNVTSTTTSLAVNSGDSFENLDADATVYPNPVMIGAKVNIQFAQDTEATIQIIDVSGKVVRRETVTGVNHEISTEGFGRGLYILQIESGKNKITKKLVVN